MILCYNGDEFSGSAALFGVEGFYYKIERKTIEVIDLMNYSRNRRGQRSKKIYSVRCF